MKLLFAKSRLWRQAAGFCLLVILSSCKKQGTPSITAIAPNNEIIVPSLMPSPPPEDGDNLRLTIYNSSYEATFAHIEIVLAGTTNKITELNINPNEVDVNPIKTLFLKIDHGIQYYVRVLDTYGYEFVSPVVTSSDQMQMFNFQVEGPSTVPPPPPESSWSPVNPYSYEDPTNPPNPGVNFPFTVSVPLTVPVVAEIQLLSQDGLTKIQTRPLFELKDEGTYSVRLEVVFNLSPGMKFTLAAVKEDGVKIYSNVLEARNFPQFYHLY